MKDFQYYQTPKISYPKKLDYTIVYVYKNGKVGDCILLEAYKKENYPSNHVIEKVIQPEFYNEVVKYSNNETELYNEFKSDLFEEFGVSDNPKKEACFEMAWNEGHANGYHEVYTIFKRLVELIK